MAGPSRRASRSEVDTGGHRAYCRGVMRTLTQFFYQVPHACEVGYEPVKSGFECRPGQMKNWPRQSCDVQSVLFECRDGYAPMLGGFLRTTAYA